MLLEWLGQIGKLLVRQNGCCCTEYASSLLTVRLSYSDLQQEVHCWVASGTDYK